MQNKQIKYTSIDELIEMLLDVKKDHPDAAVCVNGVSAVFTIARPWYYDGGYVAQDVTNTSNFLRSRAERMEGMTTKAEGFPGVCVDLVSQEPAGDDLYSLDGRSVRDIDPEGWDFLDEQESRERGLFGELIQYEWTKNTRMADGHNCAEIRAFLSSGLSALGTSRKEAKDALTLIFKESE